MAEKGYEATLTIGDKVVGKAQDVSLDLPKDKQETTTRDDNGFENSQGGIKSMSADITALWVPTDTALTGITDAWLDDSTLSFEAVDSSGYGWSCDVGVYELSRDEALEDACTIDITVESRGTISKVTGSS